MTPDGLPIVGTLADGSNVLVASGHAMLGLTMAPTTARVIRGLVTGTEAEDPETSPARFRRRPRAV
jgi:D-amino-acid dehydrogenase